ncbi:MAG: cobalamin-binding protein [Dehalococcoidia bacterium]|nr:cobalamin-binding protein [Dehalococcoidia bacterium]
MRQYILNCLIVLLAAMLSVVTGCTVPPADKTEYSIEIIDQAGRTVKLVTTPERIISLAPGNTEILYVLGLEDKVIGVTDYCNYPPEAKEKPKIGGFSTPNLEKLVAASPDVVLATSMHEKMVIPRLEELGIPVVTLEPETLDEILESIGLVGKATGREKEASEVVLGMHARIKAVTNKTDSLAQAQKPRALYITWYNPFMAAGSGTIQAELIQQAGGVNIASSLTGQAKISLEAVVTANPEVIIAGVGMGAGGDAPFQFALTEPRLADTDAVRNSRVYAVDTDLAGRSGPRITDALEQFAGFIHPELFKTAEK